MGNDEDEEAEESSLFEGMSNEELENILSKMKKDPVEPVIVKTTTDHVPVEPVEVPA